MGYQYNERFRTPLAAMFIIGFTSTLIFLIIAISLHNLYSSQFITDDPNGSVYAYHIDVGAFDICVKMDGTFIDGQGRSAIVSSDYCSHIHADCSIISSYTANGVERSDQTNIPGMDCEKWNAFRAFFVLSVIGAGMTLITSLMYIYANSRWGTKVRSYFILASFFMVFGMVSLMISWSIVASAIKGIDSRGVSVHGPAFGLAVTSWIVQVISSILFVAYHMFDPMRKHHTQSTNNDVTESYEGVEMAN